ncbi:DUF308 domain-containing protein [uncultured Massilia sp.]|uniref:DUF308 domain-containing protein n=1 Tax=uncultured Massilia sp. TaxID=169973 RepID=UPI0025EA0035|nr:DUF308 domain-containing protein [uncultured Massilia sp.]
MTQSHANHAGAVQERWLMHYYALRAAFSIAWVALALTLGQRLPAVAAVLLVGYPAWDAFANLVDARRSGGLRANRTQAVNVGVSLATTLAVLLALRDMHLVLGVFGAWAILSGLLQLGTALRRWKTSGAQWAMILSGAQSALAGTFFIAQARMPAIPSIANVAGYAGVGAFYFLVSALWLRFGALRGRTA